MKKIKVLLAGFIFLLMSFSGFSQKSFFVLGQDLGSQKQNQADVSKGEAEKSEFKEEIIKEKKLEPVIKPTKKETLEGTEKENKISGVTKPEEECPKISKEIKSLLEELEKAKKENNEQRIIEAKGKIELFQKKLKEKCLEGAETFLAEKSPVLFKQARRIEGPREIQEYYEAKMEEIFSSETKTPDQKLEALKELRKEIDQMVSNLIKERERIKMTELKDLTPEVKVKPGEIQVNDSSVPVEKQEKEITLKVKEKEIKVRTSPATVEIEDGAFKVKTNQEITVKTKGFDVAGKEIEVLPTEVTGLFKLKPEEVKEFKLIVESNKPAYEIKTVEKRKLLGIIPVKVHREIKIDASSPEKKVLEEKRPWWIIFTFK